MRFSFQKELEVLHTDDPNNGFYQCLSGDIGMYVVFFPLNGTKDFTGFEEFQGYGFPFRRCFVNLDASFFE